MKVAIGEIDAEPFGDRNHEKKEKPRLGFERRPGQTVAQVRTDEDRRCEDDKDRSVNSSSDGNFTHRFPVNPSVQIGYRPSPERPPPMGYLNFLPCSIASGYCVDSGEEGLRRGYFSQRYFSTIGMRHEVMGAKESFKRRLENPGTLEALQDRITASGLLPLGIIPFHRELLSHDRPANGPARKHLAVRRYRHCGITGETYVSIASLVPVL